MNNKSTINLICKIVLIISYMFMFAFLSEGKTFPIFSALLIIASTIGIIITIQKKTIFFLIIGIISLFLSIGIPLIILFTNILLNTLMQLIGFYSGVSLLDIIRSIPEFVSNMPGAIALIISLTICGIVFIIIHFTVVKKIKST